MKNKKAQVYIFVILAIVLVIGILLFFVMSDSGKVKINDEANPQAYIESCIDGSVDEAVEILVEQGGYIEPTNSVKYKEDKKIGYLCYNRNFYLPCINQEPMLIEHIEEEINNYIEPRVEACFNGLKQNLEKKNNVVEIGDMDLNVDLRTNQVLVLVDRDLEITKNEDTRRFEKFEVNTPHPLYNLAHIALEIVNQEAKFCNFDYLGYMIFYPNYDIRKFVTGSGVKLYTIGDVATGKEFKFAIKSCVVPPGL
jgi:hypothetical protein